MIEYLIFAIKFAWNYFQLFFVVFGWVCTILPRFLYGWIITIEQHYWIGIISFPIVLITNTLLLTYWEKRRKKSQALKAKYKKIIPMINEINNKQ